MVLINAHTINAPAGIFNQILGGHQVNIVNNSDSTPLAFSPQEFINLTNFLGRIQQSCSLVVHDAPSDFQALVGDLGTLFGVMTRIREDLEQPDSVLVQHGEQRLDSLAKVSRTLEETLKQLGNLMASHRSDATGDRTVVKRFWDSIKARWTQRQSRGIAQIRVNLGLGQASLQLVLASLGNSSLGRIEASIDRLHESLALCTMQPSIEGRVDGSVISQMLEDGDHDLDLEDGMAPESIYEATRKDLVRSKISIEDQTALLEALVSLCQQAIYRYCIENDLLRCRPHYSDEYTFGRPGIEGPESTHGVTPTTFSLMHWANKLNSVSTLVIGRMALAQYLRENTSEILAHSKELCRPAESGIRLDRSQMLKCVQSAQMICTLVDGWTFTRQARIIQDAIEHGEVKSLECIKRGGRGGADRAESRKRRRQNSE